MNRGQMNRGQMNRGQMNRGQMNSVFSESERGSSVLQVKLQRWSV